MTPEEILLGNSKRGRRPKYTVDEAAFKEPLSPLAYYFLGILFTDGCLWKEGNASYRLQLGLIDYDVIEKFVEFTKYTGIIRLENKKTSKPRKIVQISSEKLGQSLVDLGVTAAKTHTIEAPKHIAESRDFWRGCIDGDGCIGISGNCFSISLRTMSEKFADQFIRFCLIYGIKAAKCNDGCYKLVVYSKNAHQLANVLYHDCCFAMKRKLDIYNFHKIF